MNPNISLYYRVNSVFLFKKDTTSTPDDRYTDFNAVDGIDQYGSSVVD
jgi:hypothetical protein